MRVARGGLLAGAIVLVAALVGAIPAAAVTTTAWATWQPLTGTGGAYTTTVQVAAQPALTATMTSDSRAGQVSVISGATNWLAQGTPVGAKYGSSINQSYVNLRPKADNAASPSTTTYSFANPTPASGWTFVLGDIDADSVRIQAIGANGQALTAAQLGFQGGFNYCAPGVTGKPSCTGDAADVPTWDATTQTLTGNAAALDTSGAAAWFEPNVPITSLTFSFTTVTGADGGYSFPRLLSGDYEITITTPEGYVATGETSQNETVATADVADVDFELARLGAPSGVVRTDGGAPVAGAIITVTTDEGDQQLTTDADGAYGLGDLPPGTYTLTITAPAGSTIVGPSTLTVEVTAAGETFVDQDFTLAAIVVTPTDPPTTTPTPSTPPSTGGGRLPGTGLGPETFTWAAVGGAVLALGAVLFFVSRRRSRRD